MYKQITISEDTHERFITDATFGKLLSKMIRKQSEGMKVEFRFANTGNEQVEIHWKHRGESIIWLFSHTEESKEADENMSFALELLEDIGNYPEIRNNIKEDYEKAKANLTADQKAEIELYE